MSVYWNSQVAHLFHTFADEFYDGRRAWLAWLEAADKKSLITWPDLSLVTLLMVSLCASPRSKIYRQALASLRKLYDANPQIESPRNVAMAIHDFQRPDTRSWWRSLAMDRFDPRAAIIAHRSLDSCLRPGITALISRYFFVDTQVAMQCAAECVRRGFTSWDYNHCDSSVLPEILRTVLRDPEMLQPFSQMPPNPSQLANWFDICPREEQSFLTACMGLEIDQRFLVMASKYTDVTSRGLCECFFDPDANRCTSGDIERWLLDGWQEVLAKL